MSFGFSVGDFIAVTKLAWEIVQTTKTTGGTLHSLTREASNLHAILHQLEVELVKPGSTLNRAGEGRQNELMRLTGDCDRALNLLSRVLERQNRLWGGKKDVIARSWQKTRYQDGESVDLKNIRYEIVTCTKAMAIFLAQLSAGELGAAEDGVRDGNERIAIPADQVDGFSRDGLTGCSDPLRNEAVVEVNQPGILENLEAWNDGSQKLHFSSDLSLSARSNKHVSEDRLDSSYSVRNRDYLKFFKIGRVFTTLWTEGYGGTTKIKDSFVSPVVYGEQVHSKIRRFVVVRKTGLSCVCLPITVIPSKPNSRKLQSVNLAEHGIIYSNTMPRQLDGLSLPPVRVQAAKGTSAFRDYSLVDYARPCTIEMNVKVKEIGVLESESRPMLMSNFKQVILSALDAEIAPPSAPSSKSDELDALSNISSKENLDPGVVSYVETDHSTSNILQSQQGEHVVLQRQPQSNLPAIQDIKLDSKLCVIGQPGKFYKVGRVFKTLWSEPAGGTAKDIDKSFYSKIGFDELVFSKMRRFVVAREKNHSCLCLPLYTYGGQGVSKPDVRAEDHVAIQICTTDRPPNPQSSNGNSGKDLLGVIIENADERIDPMTRINFGQVFTIQHNLKVAKVGRIHPVDIERLNKYFIESVTA
ncbi:hypothetical protein BKA61DRAFT_601439 [Leptodontidium sp. MPI-SDFR-AT-0119]|nr:hypothetical protein BKA61DRAFT_601439 [Leptodontidium sp. MPI-SDFR-AT-0119]